MKYIRTATDDEKHEIFIFPKSVDHDCMMEMLARIKNTTTGRWERIRRVPVSAGFVDGNGTCYGESFTLGIGSDPTDTELLKEQYKV